MTHAPGPPHPRPGGARGQLSDSQGGEPGGGRKWTPAYVLLRAGPLQAPNLESVNPESVPEGPPDEAVSLTSHESAGGGTGGGGSTSRRGALVLFFLSARPPPIGGRAGEVGARGRELSPGQPGLGGVGAGSEHGVGSFSSAHRRSHCGWKGVFFPAMLPFHHRDRLVAGSDCGGGGKTAASLASGGADVAKVLAHGLALAEPLGTERPLWSCLSDSEHEQHHLLPSGQPAEGGPEGREGGTATAGGGARLQGHCRGPGAAAGALALRPDW